MYGDEATKLAREAKRTIDHFPAYNDPLVRSITREVRHLHETCQDLIKAYQQDIQLAEREVQRRWHQQRNPSTSSASDPNHTSLSMLESSSHQDSSLPPSTAAVAGSSRTAHGSSSTHTLNSSTRSHDSSFSTSTTSTAHLPLEAQIRLAVEPISNIFLTKYKVHFIPLQRNKRVLMAYHRQRLDKIKEIAWAYATLSEDTRRKLSPDEISFYNEYERHKNKYTAEFGDVDLGLDVLFPPKEIFITVRVVKDCGDIVTDSGATLSLKKNSEHFVKRSDVERLITQGYLIHVA
ncbi:DNA replication complex GINS protein PSF1 [Podila epicladia]|nr:DNA replication complex GINS protein PSF1 [Podila epicladia]KAG0090823.1 DNA replication complex GINS protein PSF1 [Podila epicladia]